jgi:hypothetical protein
MAHARSRASVHVLVATLSRHTHVVHRVVNASLRVIVWYNIINTVSNNETPEIPYLSRCWHLCPCHHIAMFCLRPDRLALPTVHGIVVGGCGVLSAVSTSATPSVSLERRDPCRRPKEPCFHAFRVSSSAARAGFSRGRIIHLAEPTSRAHPRRFRSRSGSGS